MSDQMLTIPIYSQNGKQSGEMTVSSEDLGGKVKKRLLKDVIIQYQNNLRQGTRSTKTRGEIQATSKKPWRQKGLGSARAGNKNSNIWRGGSVAHGVRPRNFKKEIPLRMRRGALASALLSKIQDQEIKVLDTLNFEEAKTKGAVDVLNNLKIEKSALIANHESDDNFVLSFRNLRKSQKIDLMRSTDLNAYEVVRRKHLVITQKGLEDLVQRVSFKESRGDS